MKSPGVLMVLVALFAFGGWAGACGIAAPYFFQKAIENSGDPCPEGHASVADLEAVKPAGPFRSVQVRERKEECIDGQVALTEAALYLDYASDSTVEGAAASFKSAATAAGWKETQPFIGGGPLVIDGRFGTTFTREIGGRRATLTVSVFVVVAPTTGSPGESLAAILKTGKPTGISAWIRQDAASGLPTLGPGGLNLFPTPAPGIGR